MNTEHDKVKLYARNRGNASVSYNLFPFVKYSVICIKICSEGARCRIALLAIPNINAMHQLGILMQHVEVLSRRSHEERKTNKYKGILITTFTAAFYVPRVIVIHNI